MALAILTPPSEWGDKGADIVGEGQPLVFLYLLAAYVGFVAVNKSTFAKCPVALLVVL